MQDQIKKRLEELKHEYDSGTAQLKKLQEQENDIHKMLVRISGAIEVLEELLVEKEKSQPNNPN